LSQGGPNQASYICDRILAAIDDAVAFIARDPRVRSFHNTLLNYHRTHNFANNGTYEYAIGLGRWLLGNASGFVQRLVERWQFGGIFSWTSGVPLTITAPVSTVSQLTTGTPPLPMNTPNILGDFPKNIGKVTKLPNAVTYFP